MIRTLLRHSSACLGLVCASGAGAGAETNGATAAPLYSDDFKNGLTQWVVEQQPGGSVVAQEGVLTIADEGGCTVWFRPKLRAPVTIRYEATASSAARVSDLNCFWMATDPQSPNDLFAPGHPRTGAFATYDGLRTYYLGYGGNTNTTTRFRRYGGDGTKPLLPEHDLQAPEFLLKADHAYQIEITVSEAGRVTFARDGEVIVDYVDAAALTEGWFGFRTVSSRIEVRGFSVESQAGKVARSE